jgi:hypothetical protein
MGINRETPLFSFPRIQHRGIQIVLIDHLDEESHQLHLGNSRKLRTLPKPVSQRPGKPYPKYLGWLERTCCTALQSRLGGLLPTCPT